MSCHICLTAPGTQAIKCKLCCNGIEHGACRECAALYEQYRRAIFDGEAEPKAFAALQARRFDGIQELKRGAK